jgi:hypothetical protein
MKQQARRQKGNAYVQVAEEGTESGKIAVQERLAARKDNLAHAEADQRLAMAFKV